MAHAENLYDILCKRFPIYEKQITLFERPEKEQIVLTVHQGDTASRIYLSEGNVRFISGWMTNWLTEKEAQSYADGLWFS